MNTEKKSFEHLGWRPDPQRFLKILDSPFTELMVNLQDLVTRTTTSFWSERGVRNLHLPITTDSISSPMGLGSDSEPVSVDLFGVRTYLADSMQFMLEYGCRLSDNGSWYLMPSFRGEDSDSTHLNQFFHSEAEIPGGLDDVMRASEAYVRKLGEAVLAEQAGAVRDHVGTVEHIESMLAIDEFPRMTFDEAAAHLKDDPEAVRHEQGWRSLTRHGEQRLLKEVSPVLWITHYDHLSVPFYQAFTDDSHKFAANGDLLFGIGEVVGCGERHTSADEALEALRHHEVSPDPYGWYISMKAERPMLTSGFGLGVERWLMWVLQHSDIRDLQIVPRLNGLALQP